MKNDKTSISWLAVLLAICVMLCNCSGTEVGNPDTGDPSPTINLNAFGSDQELETYLKDQFATSVVSGDIYRAGPADIDIGTAGGTAEDFTETNVQEAGVDEADVVKTDGDHFYIARGTIVSVVRAGTPVEEIARMEIKGHAEALYLHGSILAVLYTPAGSYGRPWDIAMPPTDALVGLPYWIPVRAATGIAFFDVSRPAEPGLLKSTVFDGRLVSSRLSQGKLHLVQQYLPDLPPLTVWHDGTEQGREKVIADNRLALDSLSLDQLLPRFRTEDAEGAPSEDRMVTPARLYHPTSKDGGGSIAAVVTFDLDDPELGFDTIGVVSDAHVVYASAESLYLLAHQFVRQPDLTGGYVQKLAIQKFDLGGETVQYAGGGRIDGWILNQFSLGEYKGVLRIALSTRPWGPAAQRANHINCLKISSGKLEVIGRLEDLAPGEDIYAARFIGTRGFLVTFVKVDPLFTIDMSDPTQPRLAGELKVPGYSDYIHPYGDDHLITIGKDALAVDTMTWYQGMQMSIFDVSDFSRPELRHKEPIGDRGTESEALHNHKAFTFWASQELLAIPVRLYEHQTPPAEPWHAGVNVFNGLVVYRTSEADGFERLGRMGNDTFPDFASPYMTWMRGIFSGTTVYAVAPDQILFAEVDDIAGTIQSYELPSVAP